MQPASLSTDAWTKSATRNPTPSPKLPDNGDSSRPTSEMKMAWVNGGHSLAPHGGEDRPLDGAPEHNDQVIDLEKEAAAGEVTREKPVDIPVLVNDHPVITNGDVTRGDDVTPKKAVDEDDLIEQPKPALVG